MCSLPNICRLGLLYVKDYSRGFFQHHFLITFFRVLFNIMGNDLLGQDYKERLKHSAQAGREGKSCKMKYPCNELDTSAPTSIPNKSPKKTF